MAEPLTSKEPVFRPVSYGGRTFRIVADPYVRAADFRSGRLTIWDEALCRVVEVDPEDLMLPPIPGIPPPGEKLLLREVIEEILALGFDDGWLREIVDYLSRFRLFWSSKPAGSVRSAPTNGGAARASMASDHGRLRVHPHVLGLRGSGIEIGAFHSPMPVGPGARVTYVDMFSPEVARRYYPEIPDDVALVEPAIVAPAHRIAELGDRSQDFVIASHLLEHVKDPIATLAEWHRGLKRGGTLYLVIPDMRGTFDVSRERTPLLHLIADHEAGPESRRLAELSAAHYLEWARCVNELRDPAQIRMWARLLQRCDYPIHFHCWTDEDLCELIEYMRAEMGIGFNLLELDVRDDRSEFALVLEAC